MSKKKMEESVVGKIVRVERVFGVVVPSQKLDFTGATARVLLSPWLPLRGLGRGSQIACGRRGRHIRDRRNMVI